MRQRLFKTWRGFRVSAYNIPEGAPGCYLITEIASGRKYVGSSVNVQTRIGDGWGACVTTAHQTTELARAIRKHGKGAFLVEPLYYAFSWRDVGHIRDIEETLIKAYGALFPKGFNATAFADNAKRFKTMHLDPRLAERLAASRRTPEVAAKRLAIFNTPEFKKQASEKSKKGWAQPGAKEQRSEAVRRAWSDPTLRQEQSKRLSAYLATEEGRQQRAAAMRAVNARPGMREAHAARTANLIWINNGASNSRIPKDGIVPRGWKRGRAKKDIVCLTQ